MILSFAYGVLRRIFPEEKVESVRGQDNANGVSLVVVKSFPQLQERDPTRGRFGDGRGGYGGRRGGGGGGGFSQGGRFGFSDRRNDRFPRGSGGGGRGRGVYKKS
ncbi:hypothetical protein L1887_16830 [Cichorium endivia]|nr:hypothetical protein L1887_16830 [Cichorium endivia]